MEVSRIGSRFYENAAQSGKKVKGKQQDGFAYECRKVMMKNTAVKTRMKRV